MWSTAITACSRSRARLGAVRSSRSICPVQVFAVEAGQLKAGSMSAKQTVLVIEDEAHIATMLRYNLEKAGFGVIEVVSGDEALHQIAEHNPAAVLRDGGVPGISGYEVCRQIRASTEHRALPVIMLPARGDEVDKVRALD